MSNFSLRSATLSELPALSELVNSAYRGDSSRVGWTTEADLLGGQRTDVKSLRAQLEAADSALLLAEADGGGLIGCVLLERVAGDGAYLGMLTVEPRAQRSGLGKAILEQAELYAARSWGATSVTMTVIAQRADILAWYERRGYRDTGETQPFPYGDPAFGLPRRRDLFFKVLRKPLAASPTS